MTNQNVLSEKYFEENKEIKIFNDNENFIYKGKKLYII